MMGQQPPAAAPVSQAAPTPVAPAPISQAAPAPVSQAAPAAAPAAAPPAAPAQGGVALQPTTPQLAPVPGAPGTAPAAGGIVPPGQYKTQQAVSQARQTEAIQTAETEPRENIKANTALASEASQKSRRAPGQLATLDRVIKLTETKPQFFGEWIGSDAYRAFRDSRTDGEQRDALNRLAQLARISDTDRPEFQKLMNDVRRLELDGITGSGLSATQLNTPPEQERAVRAFAVSLTDTAQAAKAQALIARATVEYNREFNKYLGSANKRLSPATLQDNFNETVGNKIFLDLQKKLEAEIPRPAAGTGSNTGFSIINRRPVQ
jgi:hypothetical protein